MQTMHKRFYHSKRRHVLWAIVVILAQAALFLSHPNLDTIFERCLSGLIKPLPPLVPLYSTIVYAIIGLLAAEVTAFIVRRRDARS